jgi:hypothetical protein
MTLTGTTLPSSPKMRVIPSFLPIKPAGTVVVPFSLMEERPRGGPMRATRGVHILISMSTPAASEPHQRVDRLGRRVEMSISRLCVRISNCSRLSLSMNGRTDDGELLDAGRQRHRAHDVGAGALRRLHDLERGLIEQPVVVRLESDADALPAMAG